MIGGGMGKVGAGKPRRTMHGVSSSHRLDMLARISARLRQTLPSQTAFRAKEPIRRFGAGELSALSVHAARSSTALERQT